MIIPFRYSVTAEHLSDRSAVRTFTVVLFVLISGLPATPLASAQIPIGFSTVDWTTDWSRHSVPLNEIEMNLGKDAIPAINSPVFVSQFSAAEWMEATEPILVLSIDGEARGYPLQILIWHEMVNDVLSGVPILVTFCPLCYSALIFDRRVEGEALRFGVSGALRHSDMVMYDKGSNSLWQQISGEAIVGEKTGQVLRAIPAQIISFQEFREVWPDGEVLSRETGFDRRYGQNPYPGYDDADDRPWLYDGPIDGRLKPMQKVVTVSIGDSHKAYSHKDTRTLEALNDELGGLSLVIFHTKNGARSALDKTVIGESRTVGSTGVFDRKLEDGRILSFTKTGGRFTDDQTGSTWNISGVATGGILKGTRLTPIAHGDMFSFAWMVIRPDSEVFEPGN